MHFPQNIIWKKFGREKRLNESDINTLVEQVCTKKISVVYSSLFQNSIIFFVMFDEEACSGLDVKHFFLKTFNYTFVYFKKKHENASENWMKKMTNPNLMQHLKIRNWTNQVHFTTRSLIWPPICQNLQQKVVAVTSNNPYTLNFEKENGKSLWKLVHKSALTSSKSESIRITNSREVFWYNKNERYKSWKLITWEENPKSRKTI